MISLALEPVSLERISLRCLAFTVIQPKESTLGRYDLFQVLPQDTAFVFSKECC